MKSIYNQNLAEALRACKREGSKPLFMPEIIDERINSDKDAKIWQNWYCAPSIRATGKTKVGSKIVVYAHLPNYFSDPDNLGYAKQKGLINGAGVMPQKSFQKLADQDGKTDEAGNQLVFAVDYDKLRKSISSVISVDQALEHPQTIPFLGGKERAEKYLEKHRAVFGNNIGIWHKDDLHSKPLGRLLFVGNDCDGGILGSVSLGDGRFAVVRRAKNFPQEMKVSGKDLTTADKEIKIPKLEEVLMLSKDYVPKAAIHDFESKLRELYNK